MDSIIKSEVTVPVVEVIKKKKVKRKTPEKPLPFLGKKFDELAMFDVFDFIQFKTQMKIVKLRAQQKREGVHDLSELIAKIPSSKKRKLKKASSKGTSSKKTKTNLVKRKLDETLVEKCLANNVDLKSRKKARAIVKTNELIKDYLKRHPKTPVEKSHKFMIQRTVALPESIPKPVVNYNQPQPMVKENLYTHPVEKVIPQQSMKPPSVSSFLHKSINGEVRSLKGNENIDNIDHVAAINTWIQKNYHSLTTAQKQLVHMQLQYLNNLKKTSFQNQAFVLSPQHLNNLNNVAFLHENYNPFTANYSNLMSVPSYSVDVVNQQNLQLLKALQQQQQNYRVQMPLNFSLPKTNDNSINIPRSPSKDNNNFKET